MMPEKIWVKGENLAGIPESELFGRWSWKKPGTEYTRSDLYERVKAERDELFEKAQTLVLMHVAEQEGLRPPTPQQWMDAVDELGTALAKARGEVR